MMFRTSVLLIFAILVLPACSGETQLPGLRGPPQLVVARTVTLHETDSMFFASVVSHK